MRLTNGMSCRKGLTDLFWSEFREGFKHELCRNSPTRKGFHKAVRIMKSRWDDMKRRSGNPYLDDRAWNWFYESTVLPVKQALFPEDNCRDFQEHVPEKEAVMQKEENRIPWENILIELLIFALTKRRRI